MTDLSERTAGADHELAALFSDVETRANPYPSYRRIRELVPCQATFARLTRARSCSSRAWRLRQRM